jgi:hypothetical protein
VVGDIDDGHVGIDLENDAFDRADEMVVGTVVSGESDDGVRQWMLQPGLGRKTRPRNARRNSSLFTLTKRGFAVKNVHSECCAIANVDRHQRSISFRLARARRNATRDRGSAAGIAKARNSDSGAPQPDRRAHRGAKRPGRACARAAFSWTCPYSRPWNGLSIQQSRHACPARQVETCSVPLGRRWITMRQQSGRRTMAV